MKKTVVTFGSHGPYISAGVRLMKQCENSHLFDNHILYTPEQLQSDFWNRHKQFVEMNPRGYGYWLWKPYIIKKTMQSMKDGDILLYMDCGCELDIEKSSRIQEKITLVKHELLIGTIFSPHHTDASWTKRDVIDRIRLPMNLLSTPQRQAGALLFLVCPRTRILVHEWYALCCDYHNIDDSPSILPNAPTFVEHRHDQSVFSLLSKKHNLVSSYSLDCINYIRNRSGESKLKHKHRFSLFKL
jgi:hypothetical protein